MRYGAAHARGKNDQSTAAKIAPHGYLVTDIRAAKTPRNTALNATRAPPMGRCPRYDLGCVDIHRLRIGVGLNLSVADARHAEMLADLGLDFGQDLGVIAQELLGVLAPLAQADIFAVAIPG